MKLSRLLNTALFASAAATALAVSGLPQIGPDGAEAMHPASYDLTDYGSWNFGGGVTGTGKHCIGWANPLLINLSARTTISPDTDNSIGVNAFAYDRCNISESWVLIVSTGWYKAYSGSSQVETAHHGVQPPPPLDRGDCNLDRADCQPRCRLGGSLQVRSAYSAGDAT